MSCPPAHQPRHHHPQQHASHHISSQQHMHEEEDRKAKSDVRTASTDQPQQDSGGMAQSSISAHQQMLASCTGAVLTSLTMTPFDVVKNRLQAQNQPQVRNCHTAVMGAAGASQSPTLCSGCGTSHAPRIRFQGTMDAFLKIGQHEGLHTLWRGMTPTLIMSVPGTVVYFSLYDQIRPHLGESKYSPGACGAVSRIFAATAVSPLEMLRTKMQANQGIKYSDAFSVIGRTIRTEGFGSLYRGLGPTLLRDVPFSALYWTGYEWLRARIGEHLFPSSFREAAPPISVSFLAGALAGSLAAVTTLPFDVIKTRQQSLLGEAFESAPGKYGVAREPARVIIRDIYQHYGFRGFFAGMTPRVAKVAPACAIMISTYEFFKQFFRERNRLAS